MSYEATDSELDTFWGRPATEYEWANAKREATQAYDADDVQVAAYELAAEILDALRDNDFQKVGEILATARAVTIARRTSFAVTGRFDA